MEKEIISKAELIRRTGIGSEAINELITKGLPIVSRGGRGKKWAFDWNECRKFIQDTKDPEDMTLSQRLFLARTKKEEALAQTRQLELQIKQEQYVPLEEYLKAYEKELAMIRQRFLGMGQKLATDLIGIMDPISIKEQIEAEVNEIIAELSENPFSKNPQSGTETPS
jgi:phage terminase Nu1 subunit (DNA packaging protein)